MSSQKNLFYHIILCLDNCWENNRQHFWESIVCQALKTIYFYTYLEMHAWVLSCVRLCCPMDCSLPGSCVHGISRQEYWTGLSFPSPGDLPDLGIVPRIPQWRQMLYWLSHQEVHTKVGSYSLLQGIFPTKGLNPGLPHCKWILYQLSHKGSPK